MTDRIVLYSESTANRLDLASGQTAQNSYTIPHAGGSFPIFGGRAGSAVAGSEVLFRETIYPVGSALGPSYGQCELLDNQQNPTGNIVYAHMPRLAVDQVTEGRYGVIQYFGQLRDCQEGQNPPICHTGWVITHAECEPDDEPGSVCSPCGFGPASLNETEFDVWWTGGCVSPSGSQGSGSTAISWDALAVRLSGDMSIPISANSAWYMNWIVSSTSRVPFQQAKVTDPSQCGPLDAQIGIEATWDEITQTLNWRYWIVNAFLYDEGMDQIAQIADFTNIAWRIEAVNRGGAGLYDLQFGVDAGNVLLEGREVQWLDPWYWGVRIQNIGDQPENNPDRGRVDNLEGISNPCTGPINVP